MTAPTPGGAFVAGGLQNSIENAARELRQLLALLCVVVVLLATACGPYAYDSSDPKVDAAPAAPFVGCAVSLTAPIHVQGADGSAGGHCDVSPWVGTPGDQFFELYSNAGGVNVRVSVSRAAPQGVALPLGYGVAAAWDWTANCGRWAGTVTWSDAVTHDAAYSWIEHHDWAIAVDVVCVDGSGYHIAGTYAGHS